MTIRPDLPDLSDEQVDRMYRRITATVEHDAVVRRAKRRKIALAAASVVAVLGLGGAVVGGVTLVPQGSDTAGDSSVPDERALRGEQGPNAATEDAGGGAGADSGSGSDDGIAAREIVTTASAVLTVDAPRDAADALAAWTEDEGGRVESRDESTHDGRTTVSLRLRVPADSTGDTTERLRTLGTVSGLRIDTEDVTAQGRDLDARIRALQVSVVRLQELMSEASSTADLLAAEQTLAQRQSDLEALQAQRRGLSDQVAMATYDVVVRSEREPDAPSSSGFLGALDDGWDAMVASLGFVVRVLGFVLPWAVLLAVLGAVYVAGRRVIRR
ncbi:DUF4349 domain-containing protein [Mumia sp. DW29H23]|uniref:DUF4349 domain-containing protein n=1 Tax=Mumia sp. DW29H23 TaxID=3421241 RepID=UPI003D68FD72